MAGVGLFWVLLLVGCAATAPPSLGPAVELSFVQDGVTTMAACVQRLGPASKTLPGRAGGKVLTFWFNQDAGGLHAGSTAPSSDLVAYTLVLSFDVQGVLARHSLVKVWGH